MPDKGAVVSLIQTTADFVKSQSFDSAGLLASPTSIRHGLFTKKIPSLITLNTKEQAKTESIIRAVIAGGAEKQKEVLSDQIRKLKRQGAQKIILGCTELSVIDNKRFKHDIIDPIDLVAGKIVGGKL